MDPAPAALSLIVATENGVRQTEAVLRAFQAARREGDKVVLLTRSDRVREFPGPVPPWLRIVGVPDASDFTLRAHIPAVASRDWIVLVEEHSLVTAASVRAIREMIESRPNLDLIPFLGRNLTSRTPWSWANFLHTFAFAWSPQDRPPPFSPVTAVAVRRGALQRETPLREGEWENHVIPRISARGRMAYSNEIYVDHVKHVDLARCLALNYHNARACTHLLRGLGASRWGLLRWALYGTTIRPIQLALALRPRRRELPPRASWKLAPVGAAAFVGTLVGAFFGPGDSAHRLD